MGVMAPKLKFCNVDLWTSKNHFFSIARRLSSHSDFAFCKSTISKPRFTETEGSPSPKQNLLKKSSEIDFVVTGLMILSHRSTKR